MTRTVRTGRGFGIDIGGSGIKGAPVDLRLGKFALDRVRIPTPQPATPESVADVVDQIIDGKGATSLAIGLAVSRILEAVLKNERRVLPVSSLLTPPSPFAGVCLSMPSILGREGVLGVLDTPLDDTERTALDDSFQQVRSVAHDLGLSTRASTD